MVFRGSDWTNLVNLIFFKKQFVSIPMNKVVKQRTDVVGVFPDAASVTCLAVAGLMEQGDDRQISSSTSALNCG